MKYFKVSIIIPAYNAKDYIQKCISNLLNQTYENIEIIVIDDGSTDNTYEIAKNICGKDARVNLFRQENKGTFYARAKGVKEAKGKYVLFVDSDDYIENNAIERLMDVANRYNSEIVRFRYRKIPDGYDQYMYYNKDEKYIAKSDFSNNIYPFFLEGYMLNAVCTNFIKKDIIPNIVSEEKMTFGEDLLFNLELYTKANNATFISDVLYNYVTMENSITKTRKVDTLLQNLKNCITAYGTLYKYIKIWDIDNRKNRITVAKRIVYETASIINRIRFCEIDKENINKINIQIEALLKDDIIKNAIDKIDINEFESSNKYYFEINTILKEQYKNILIE